MSEERRNVENIQEAFDNEFERFSNLALDGLPLQDAEGKLRELGELKVKHTGKKSPIADAKKLIGKVSPEERSAFGQLVQSVEKDMASKIETAEAALSALIATAKTELGRLDVTLPGRRPRTGHLHPITILR